MSTKSYKTIDAKEFDKTMLRITKLLAEGHRFSYEIVTKDRCATEIELRVGNECVKIVSAYGPFNISETMKPGGWIGKIRYTSQAKKILESANLVTEDFVKFSGEDVTRTHAYDEAVKRAKETLKRVENRFREVANLYEGALENDYEIECVEFKVVGGETVAVEKDVVLDMPF